MSDPLANQISLKTLTLKRCNFGEFITESELGGGLHVVVDELTELHHGQREAR
jgi:hypothetical protein